MCDPMCDPMCQLMCDPGTSHPGVPNQRGDWSGTSPSSSLSDQLTASWPGLTQPNHEITEPGPKTLVNV